MRIDALLRWLRAVIGQPEPRGLNPPVSAIRVRPAPPRPLATQSRESET